MSGSYTVNGDDDNLLLVNKSESESELESTQQSLHYTLSLLEEHKDELETCKSNLDESHAIISNLELEIKRLNTQQVPKPETDILGRLPHPSLQGGDIFC